MLKRIEPKIKNIIFDLGGVVLNVDYHLTSQKFAQLGMKNFEDLYSQAHQNQLFDEFEMGKISSDDFLKTLQNLTNNSLNFQQITDAWNAMILDYPISRLQLLEQIKHQYNTFLLSNTNSIHEKEFTAKLQRTTNYQNLDTLFNKVYYSHLIGYRKPQPEAYLFILKENNLSAEETLFIDDSIQNIEGAQRVGLQTIYLKKGMNLENDVFEQKEKSMKISIKNLSEKWI